MALSFIFDASKETPQSLAKKRAVAEALAGRSRAPQNIGEGLTALGEALGYRMMIADVDKGEAAGREQAAAAMAPLLGARTFPDAPHTTGTPGAGSTVSGAEAPDMDGNQIYSEFMDSVKKGGVDNPYALAAIAATGKAESGFSPGNVFRTWSDPSESGQAGTAGGIMSWRADRLAKMQDFAAANGGDRARPSPALQAQFLLQEDPNLIQSLQSAKSAEEAQRLMNNAWKFAGYDRPGGETARRIGLANSFASQFAGSPAPVQVASLDPTAGIAEATAPQTVPPMPEEYAKIGLSQGSWARMNAPDSAPVAKPAAAAQPATKPAATSPAAQRVLAAMMTPKPLAYAPQEAKPSAFPQVTGALEKAAAPEAQPTPATARVAQALGGAEAYRGTAIDSDMPGHAPLQPGEAGPTLQQLMQAASDPWLSEQQRGMVNMMIEQKMQSADPIRQLQLQKLQKELGTPQKQWQKLDDGTLFDPATGETKHVGKSTGGPFRFEGNSVEAQSLNGLMDSGALTPEQAQQLGAGKTITNPADGSVMFMTPQGVFGQAAPGGPATPLSGRSFDHSCRIGRARNRCRGPSEG
ncbi:phage tail tip lysozyme [Aminobacter sp. LjRoot7]|uniref:phage tail tip lysozyme n=1 Tax=Aminobacter sp. LjRoot7 TaxID=3342335 RepID=UPI003ECE0559